MLVSCQSGSIKPVKNEEDSSRTELDKIYEKIDNESEKEKIIDLNDSPIYKFYENRSVLVTGATGYLGKVLVEKLLRTCPIKKVYIVLRPKKSKSMDERGQEIFNNVVSKK